MHARFSTVHANLLVEKALSAGKNADQALADASQRDRNKRTARVVLGGEMNPREEEDLLAALRSLWARTDLTGMSTDDASLGEWKVSLPPLSSTASAAFTQRRRAVFQRPQEIIEFVQECLNSRPRNMYFKWTMCVTRVRADVCTTRTLLVALFFQERESHRGPLAQLRPRGR